MTTEDLGFATQVVHSSHPLRVLSYYTKGACLEKVTQITSKRSLCQDR